MVIVTNKIKVRKGMAAKMAPRFTSPGPLDTTPGIKKVEVWLTQNLEDHDELNVNMYWDNMDSFESWKNSDAFKQAHKRPAAGSDDAKKESPIIGSELVTYEMASIKEISQ
ncbi:heme oxygenase [Bacillus massiliglaciei]|uniref:heme oxygenase n=1 Tax=Bacillus massiliglaciei TaxID=1816693 RepID=UPI000A78B896|nr:heme oxygenase [Bacillus massiliglaciei]